MGSYDEHTMANQWTVTAWSADGMRLDLGDYWVDLGGVGDHPWDYSEDDLYVDEPIGYTEKADRFTETPHTVDHVEKFIAPDGEPALRLVKKLAFRHEKRTRVKTECAHCDETSWHGSPEIDGPFTETCHTCDGRGWRWIES